MEWTRDGRVSTYAASEDEAAIISIVIGHHRRDDTVIFVVVNVSIALSHSYTHRCHPSVCVVVRVHILEVMHNDACLGHSVSRPLTVRVYSFPQSQPWNDALVHDLRVRELCTAHTFTALLEPCILFEAET